MKLILRKIKLTKMNFKTAKLSVFALAILATSFTACKKDSVEDEAPIVKEQEVIEGQITGPKTLDANKKYLLRGYVRVMAGGKLTIPAGTVIMGEKASKAALIIEKDGQVFANGEPNKPVVFTSDQPAGEDTRKTGDWSGVVICGKSRVNTADGTAQYEGGALGANVAAYGGGATPKLDDNSGVFKYVRIEFAGIAIEKDKEINGLTLCGVGSGTEVHHVQISYGGDDGFEFFGGTVNAKNLIVYRGVDDDFDFDQGYTGKLQYGLSIKDPNIADAAGTSRGIELENKGTVSRDEFTRPVISNFTFLGPGAAGVSFHGAGIHFGLNSRMVLSNSIVVNARGNAVEFNSDFPAAELKAGRSTLSNNVIFGNTANFGLTSVTSFVDVAALTTFVTAANNSMVANLEAAGLNSSSFTSVDLGLKATSPAVGKAKYEGADLSDAYFTKETFAGALGSNNWTTGWASWSPKTNAY